MVNFIEAVENRKVSMMVIKNDTLKFNTVVEVVRIEEGDENISLFGCNNFLFVLEGEPVYDVEEGAFIINEGEQIVYISAEM